MIVISNNVRNLDLEIPDTAVIRINIAWINTIKELEEIIKLNAGNDVWVDYPTGRKKPPVPKLMYDEVIKILKKYKNIQYFAFSNAEEASFVWDIRKQVPKKIKLIPKIETVEGVRNLVNIVKAAETDTIMLDKEDLYTDVNHDPKCFEIFCDYVKKVAKENNIKVLSLQGVIFA
jgi:pyruvate kinase